MGLVLDLFIAYVMSNSIPLFIAIKMLKYSKIDEFVVEYFIKVIRYQKGYDG